MAYLDGEMDAAERSKFERVLLERPELQDELAQFQRLDSILQRVRIPEPKPELWDEFPRRNTDKVLRLVGWVLFVAGALLVGIASEYFLWTSNGIHWTLKLGITVLALGLLTLLGSVIQCRRREGKTDRYKEIIR